MYVIKHRGAISVTNKQKLKTKYVLFYLSLLQNYKKKTYKRMCNINAEIPNFLKLTRKTNCYKLELVSKKPIESTS